MARNAIKSDFHQKWPPAAIAIESFAIESGFRSSKMAAGSHFAKKKSKLRIDLKWRELRSKVIFQNGGGGGGSQWPACKHSGIYTVLGKYVADIQEGG